MTIVSLLTFQTDDVEDLWNNSGISWRLTLNEVKKIAALRQEQF